MFSFNSPHYDLILIKSYLLPVSVSERDIETTVIKKAIQFIWSNFCDNQLLDIMKFLSGATSLDSFLKAYKISETKDLFPYEEIDQPDKTQKTEHSPMTHNIQDAFYSKLRSCNSHEAEHTDYANLLKSGLTTEPAAFKLISSKPPPFGIENCHVVQQTLKQEQMSSFKNLLRWYSSEDVLPILEATQKRLLLPRQRYRNIKAVLHIRDNVVGRPSIVFPGKAIVDETLFRKSTNLSKSVFGIDVSQLYPYSLCQPLPTGFLYA